MGHRKSGHYLFTAYTLLVVNFPGQSANQGYSAIEQREEFSIGHCQNAMTQQASMKLGQKSRELVPVSVLSTDKKDPLPLEWNETGKFSSSQRHFRYRVQYKIANNSTFFLFVPKYKCFHFCTYYPASYKRRIYLCQWQEGLEVVRVDIYREDLLTMTFLIDSHPYPRQSI